MLADVWFRVFQNRRNLNSHLALYTNVNVQYEKVIRVERCNYTFHDSLAVTIELMLPFIDRHNTPLKVKTRLPMPVYRTPYSIRCKKLL